MYDLLSGDLKCAGYTKSPEECKNQLRELKYNFSGYKSIMPFMHELNKIDLYKQENKRRSESGQYSGHTTAVPTDPRRIIVTPHRPTINPDGKLSLQINIDVDDDDDELPPGLYNGK